MATPQQQIQPQTPSVANLAPIKPLLELKRGGKTPSTYLSKAIQKLFTHFHGKDKQVFREIVNVGQRISLMINGKQFLWPNPIDGSWGVLPLSGNDDRRALNVMNSLKQNLLGKWEGSNADILIGPGRNVDTCASAAKAANAIVNYYERQFYDEWFSQQECLMGMTFGTYIDRYRFDENKVSMSVIQDIFEQKDATFGEGAGLCGDCGYGGSAQEFQSALGGDGPLSRAKCPNCGSTAVDITPPANGSIYTMTGRQEKQIGDLVCELLPMPACRWDLAKRPEDSSWFIYRQRIPKGSVNRVMGNILLPASEVENDHGLEVLRALQHEGQALSGFSNYGNQRKDDDGDRDSTTFDEMWLSPDDYADINLIGDEETLSGNTLPRGRLVDHFPNGLCAVGLNGMSVVLALYSEKHREHIVSGTWFTQAQTGSGRGLADSVEIQKQFNTLNNQALAYMSSTYTPAIGYDNQIWSGNKMKYIGTPRTNIPFDLTKLPDGRKLADSIYQFQPTAMPNQFFTYAQDFLNIMFQKTSMVTDYQQGEPGIAAQNTTARAAEIDQDNADNINEPIFRIKAGVRRRGAEITIRLFRQHFPMKRYFDLGGRYGQTQGIELSAADVDADLVFDVARNSWMPKGPLTQLRNLNNAATQFGGYPGLFMAMKDAPRETSMVLQTYDVDLEFDEYDDVAELCRKRLNQMKEAVKVGVTDPMVLIQAIQPPISEAELKLEEKAKWFAESLDWDETQNAPMPLRQAIEFLAQSQFHGAIQQQTAVATGQGVVAAAGAAPAAVGQAALEQQSQQPESTEPDPTAVLQMQQEQSQQAHESMMADKEHQHALEEIKVDADHAIRVEKSKPRPKVASKAAK